MSTLHPREALWDFALRLYGRPGISKLCIRLQDEHGLDVNILLTCIWLADRHQPMEVALLESIVRVAAPLRARIRRIRALRRALECDRAANPVWEPSLRHLKKAELAAERVELHAIEAAVASLSPFRAPSDPISLALEGCTTYARRLGAQHSLPMLHQFVDRAFALFADHPSRSPPRPAPDIV